MKYIIQIIFETTVQPESEAEAKSLASEWQKSLTEANAGEEMLVLVAVNVIPSH